MKYHTTKEGNKIKLEDLELSHLKNIIKWIDRKAAEGVTVRMGGGGVDVDDCWYEEETYYGEDVRRDFNYYHYVAELNKRTL